MACLLNEMTGCEISRFSMASMCNSLSWSGFKTPHTGRPPVVGWSSATSPRIVHWRMKKIQMNLVQMKMPSCASRCVTEQWAAWWRSTDMWVRGWGWISAKKAFHSHGMQTRPHQPDCPHVPSVSILFWLCFLTLTCFNIQYVWIRFHMQTRIINRIILPLVAESAHCTFRMLT